jgi:hypothetical protein
MLDETGILGGVPRRQPTSYPPASNKTGSQDQGPAALVSAEIAIQSYELQTGLMP